MQLFLVTYPKITNLHCFIMTSDFMDHVFKHYYFKVEKSEAYRG